MFQKLVLSIPFQNPNLTPFYLPWPDPGHGTKIITADSGYCLNQAFLMYTKGRTGESPVGEINSPQAATDVVAKQSLGSWSHLWSLNSHSGCGSTSLFGSHAGTHQIRDQSHALEDRNDSNNSLEVHTLNSFIHLLYNSPHMDIVNMHNINGHPK